MEEAEYDVESMPDDEILSISKDDEELDDSDKELIVADEVVPSVSDSKPTPVMPMEDVQALVVRALWKKKNIPSHVHNLSKSLPGQFVDKMDSMLLTDLVRKTLPWFNKRIKNVIQDEMPTILQAYVLKPLNKEFNALNKLECKRFAILEGSIRKSIYKNVRVKMGKMEYAEGLKRVRGDNTLMILLLFEINKLNLVLPLTNGRDNGCGKLNMQAKQKDVEEAQQKSFVRMKQQYKETKGDKRDLTLKLFALPYRPAFICSGVQPGFIRGIRGTNSAFMGRRDFYRAVPASALLGETGKSSFDNTTASPLPYANSRRTLNTWTSLAELAIWIGRVLDVSATIRERATFFKLVTRWRKGFDEYMNLVLDQAEEVSIKKKTKKPLAVKKLE
ncbi:hypothetical protein Tco_0017703 [Tanacetum coccineum]